MRIRRPWGGSVKRFLDPCTVSDWLRLATNQLPVQIPLFPSETLPCWTSNTINLRNSIFYLTDTTHKNVNAMRTSPSLATLPAVARSGCPAFTLFSCGTWNPLRHYSEGDSVRNAYALERPVPSLRRVRDLEVGVLKTGIPEQWRYPTKKRVKERWLVQISLPYYRILESAIRSGIP